MARKQNCSNTLNNCWIVFVFSRTPLLLRLQLPLPLLPPTTTISKRRHWNSTRRRRKSCRNSKPISNTNWNSWKEIMVRSWDNLAVLGSAGDLERKQGRCNEKKKKGSVAAVIRTTKCKLGRKDTTGQRRRERERGERERGEVRQHEKTRV